MKIALVGYGKMGHMVDRTHRDFSKADIELLADTFEAYRNGTLEDKKGFCAVKTLQDISAQDYILTPGRYVGIEEQEDDGEPFAKAENKLFDAYFFYFSRKSDGLVRHWIVGDYKVHIGKGLTAGIEFMNNGMGLLTSRHDHSQGFFAHAGTDEYNFLRGGAIQLGYKNLSVMLFSSLRHVDGRIQGDSAFSLITTGYHRMPLERERKNNIQNATMGTSIDLQFKQFHTDLRKIHTGLFY